MRYGRIVGTARDRGAVARLGEGRPRSQSRPTRGRSWYEIRNAAARRADTGPSFAELYIYDEISYWGVSAQALVDELGTLQVDELDVHINSPGGDMFEGIAIYQALLDHPAQVCVYVDSLAASIASVIAMAGDRIVMGRMAQMMIHDAWGVCVGNADVMRQMAEELDRFSNTIAGAYAERSGQGTARQWRKAMLAETWYDANEAVAAGLADEVASRPAEVDDDTVAARLARTWDAGERGWRYAGRQSAPAPQTAGGGATPPDPPPAPPTPDDPDPEAPAADWVLPEGIDFAAVFRDAISAAAEPPEIPIDGADIAALITHEAEHRPAPPAVDPLPAPPVIDLNVFATALKEGLHS